MFVVSVGAGCVGGESGLGGGCCGMLDPAPVEVFPPGLH